MNQRGPGSPPLPLPCASGASLLGLHSRLQAVVGWGGGAGNSLKPSGSGGWGRGRFPGSRSQSAEAGMTLPGSVRGLVPGGLGPPAPLSPWLRLSQARRGESCPDLVGCTGPFPEGLGVSVEPPTQGEASDCGATQTATGDSWGWGAETDGAGAILTPLTCEDARREGQPRTLPLAGKEHQMPGGSVPGHLQPHAPQGRHGEGSRQGPPALDRQPAQPLVRSRGQLLRCGAGLRTQGSASLSLCSEVVADFKKHTPNFGKICRASPECCGSGSWVSSCEPKGRLFDSRSGHLPGFPSRSSAGGGGGGGREATDCSSPSLLSPLSQHT